MSGVSADCSIVRKRRPLSSRFSITATLDAEYESPHFPVLIDSAVRNLLPEEVWSGELIADCKGWERNELQLQLPPEERPIQKEELLFARGEIVDPALDERRFTLSVSTTFEKFSGAQHILHRPAIITEGALRGVLDSRSALRELGRLIPVRIAHFRLQLEYFSARRIPLLGVVPAVNERLQLWGDSNRARLVLASLASPDSEDLPLQERPIAPGLARFCSEALAVSIQQLE